MIFAKLDVDITDHPKAIEAGPAAFGLWAWALAYCRKHELDGAIGIGAVRHALGGDPGNLALADKLVEVGLWANRDGGWTVLNYASKNETKAGIAERRAADRARKAPRVVPHPPPFREESKRAPLIEVVGIPGSDSGSDSGSDPEGSAEGGGRQTAPPKDIPITDGIKANCVMAGAPAPTKAHVVAALAHARDRGHTSSDWGSYLTRCVCRERQFASKFGKPVDTGPPEKRARTMSERRTAAEEAAYFADFDETGTK